MIKLNRTKEKIVDAFIPNSIWLWHLLHQQMMACGMVHIGSGNGLLPDITKHSAILHIKHTWLPTCLN